MYSITAERPEIESKNLVMMEDLVKREALAVKKSELYADHFADPALKSCARQLAIHHRDNISAIKGYLETHR